MRNKTLQQSFFKISIFSHSDFLSYLPKKRNIVLDFGCGNGCFHKNFSNKKIKLIKMYDKNKSLKSYINKKYDKNPYIKWTNNLHFKYNVVLINSTIQYLTLKNYKSLINYFFKKKVDIIIISDIPKFPFYAEAFFCIFINIKRLLISFKYLFQKKYNFYHYKNMKELIIKNYFYDYNICNNLNEDKLLRYSLIFNKSIPKKN